MKPTLIFAAALFAVAALAGAPVGAEAPLAPDDIPAGVYTIETKDTLVRYEVLHFGYSDYWGTFPGATGTLTLDPKNIAASKLDVKVPIWSVETTNRELDGELFSDEFFDGETYGSMRFVSTTVTRTGPRTAKVAGDLTMHNITRPVVLEVTFVAGGPDPFDGKGVIIGFRAQGAVKRSDFGLGKYVPIVSDETRIVISASLRRS